MIATRKLSKAVGLASLMLASSAMSVGLGDIQLNSALSEPLDAQISLLSVDGMETTELLVSLASSEDFKRAGVTREFFLTQLDFEVDPSQPGDPVIKVSSNQPVSEPYLDFLVQLQWPSGRIMREYTLLLDLPIYTGGQQAAKPVKKVTSGPRSVTKSAAKEKTSSPPRQKAPTKPVKRLTGDEYTVQSGDTLWRLAQRVRPEDASIQQTMDVLFEGNQHAFINGNIDLLKQGSVLRLPDSADVSSLKGSKPVEQVASETTAVEKTPQLSAVEKSPASQPKPVEQQSARLELASATVESGKDNVLSAQGSPEANAGGTVEVAQLSNELAISQDEVNKVQRENAELRERLALLEEQVSTMTTLVDVQSESAAAAQKDIQQVETPADKEAPVTTPNEEAESPLPWYVWAAGVFGAILLALLVFLGLRSKSSKDEEELTLEGYQKLEEEKGEQKTAPAVALDDLDEFELSPEDNLFDTAADNKRFFEEEPAAADQNELSESLVDVVSEAEIYLSLGNTDQAVEILEEARASDSSDTACRLKLMEVLFKQGRKDEMKPLFQEIKAAGDKDAIAMAAVIIGPEEEQVTHLDSDGSDDAMLHEDTDISQEQESDLQEESAEVIEAADLDDDIAAVEQQESVGEDDSSSELDFDLELDMTSDTVDDEVSPEETPETPEAVATEAPDAEADELDLGDLDGLGDIDDLGDLNEVDTKLDLAKTYLEMGDPEGARGILEEVVAEADEDGQNRARKMLEEL